MAEQRVDPRHLLAGTAIPKPAGCHYADQPYVVVNGDGSWTCVMTSGSGAEGAHGQHIVATISEDRGASWSPPVAVEPPDGPEASWAQPLYVPELERIYVFYTYNKHNKRVLKDQNGEACVTRVDSFGAYAYRYSDDRGRTWSAKRYEIPQRRFAIDRENVYGGEILFFWGVGHPFFHKGEAIVPFSKVGGFGPGFFVRNEGALLASPNLRTEPDPAKHEWHTRPEGEVGIRTPPGGGPIAGELNACPMNDGSLYATYRTIDGYAAHAYSRDNGRSWRHDWMRYRPGGRAVKNPRSANFAWRLANGNYVYWFNNHGGEPLARWMHENPALGYAHRNPTFLLGGVERDGEIHWSEPEIALYHDQIGVRWSYPDLVEQENRVYLTETEKTQARVHEIDRSLLEAMWRQGHDRAAVRDGLLTERTGAGAMAMPELPPLYSKGGGTLDPDTGATLGGAVKSTEPRGGLSLELTLRFDELAPWQLVFDSRDGEGRGMTVMLTDRGTLKLSMVGRNYDEPGGKWSAGLCESSWDTDPGVIAAGATHHVVFVVDGGPKLITVVADGSFCDGGDVRQYGWGRFHPALKEANGAETAAIAPDMRGAVERVRLYGRALRTSEAVANYHAAIDEGQLKPYGAV